MFKISDEIKEFYNLNKRVLNTKFILYCFVCLIFYLFFCLYLISNNSHLLIIILLSVLGLFLLFVFSLGIIFLDHIYKFWIESKNMRSITSTFPLNKLSSIGFEKRILIKDKLNIKKYVLCADKQGFVVVVYPKNRNVLIFKFLVYMDKFPERDVFLEFKSWGFILENHSISKEINLKSEILSLEKFESIFKEIIFIIEIYKFKPVEINLNGEY